LDFQRSSVKSNAVATTPPSGWAATPTRGWFAKTPATASLVTRPSPSNPRSTAPSSWRRATAAHRRLVAAGEQDLAVRLERHVRERERGNECDPGRAERRIECAIRLIAHDASAGATSHADHELAVRLD
jgi:hypothetical protein